MKDLDTIIGKILKYCRQEETIIAAYLFGSLSTEKNRVDSDIDVAVLVEPGAEEKFPFLAFAVSLERELNHRIDLILLNRAGELLKYEVRRHGRLIFERDAGKRKRFEIKSRKFFEDFLFLHKRYVNQVLYESREER